LAFFLDDNLGIVDGPAGVRPPSPTKFEVAEGKRSATHKGFLAK